MMAEPDDEALSWSGPADPSYVEARATDEVRTRGATSRASESSGAGTAQQTSSAMLIMYGVFVGIYLLFTIGWMIAALRNTSGVGFVFGQFMYQFGEFLAITAPALWLLTTMFLTKNSRAALRVLWLLIGVLVLVPWPFVLGV